MKAWISIIVLVAVGTVSAKEPDNWQQVVHAADLAVEQYWQSEGLPSIAYGLVRRGDTHSRSFGVLNQETGELASPQSIYHLASLSKTVVAVAAMRLVQEGRLTLDAPVSSILPYFDVEQEGQPLITARHLLAHTSGLPDVQDYEWGQGSNNDNALEEYVRSLAGTKLRSPPGATYIYSNMGYEVLGDVIAKSSGEIFEDQVEKAVFRKLGMNDSTFSPPMDRPLAQPHRVNDQVATRITVFPYNRRHAPSSTLYSNVEDMLLWLRFHLTGTPRLLSERSMDTLLGESVTRNVDSSRPVSAFQAIGWSGLIIEGITLYGHGGLKGSERRCYLSLKRRAVCSS